MQLDFLNKKTYLTLHSMKTFYKCLSIDIKLILQKNKKQIKWWNLFKVKLILLIELAN